MTGFLQRLVERSGAAEQAARRASGAVAPVLPRRPAPFEDVAAPPPAAPAAEASAGRRTAVESPDRPLRLPYRGLLGEPVIRPPQAERALPAAPAHGAPAAGLPGARTPRAPAGQPDGLAETRLAPGRPPSAEPPAGDREVPLLAVVPSAPPPAVAPTLAGPQPASARAPRLERRPGIPAPVLPVLPVTAARPRKVPSGPPATRAPATETVVHVTIGRVEIRGGGGRGPRPGGPPTAAEEPNRLEAYLGERAGRRST